MRMRNVTEPGVAGVTATHSSTEVETADDGAAAAAPGRAAASARVTKVFCLPKQAMSGPAI